MKKILSYLIRLLITVAILAALFKFIPLEQLIKVISSSNKIFLSLAIVTYSLCYLFGILRWQALLRALSIDLGFKETAYALLSGYCVNLFFPSFIGGDVFRSWAISRCHGKAQICASTVVMDRLFGGVALSVIVLIAYIFGNKLLPKIEVFGVILIYVSIFTLICLMAFSKSFLNLAVGWMRPQSKFRQKVELFCQNFYLARQSPKKCFLPLVYSLIIQITVPLSFYFSLRAFGANPDIISVFILVPIIMVLAFLPITIAGAGTREAASVYYLSLIGISPAVGLATSLMNMAVLVVVGVIGGIIYVTVYHRWLQRSPSLS